MQTAAPPPQKEISEQNGFLFLHYYWNLLKLKSNKNYPIIICVTNALQRHLGLLSFFLSFFGSTGV
jgi:hypothetical protein